MKGNSIFLQRHDNKPRIFLFLVVLALVWVVATPVFAATPGGADIAWGIMGMELLGGLSLFLFGMEQMSEALKNVAGERMRDILAKLTSNRLMGLLTGSFVTAIIQSSSVTTVMLVGFVTAGLMSLSQAIGVILGADIGTTITAQIVAFPVQKYALLLITFGFLLQFLGKRDRIKQYGILIMGLGMIFFGMGVMSKAMAPLRTFEPFILLMQEVSNPLIGILLSAVFTALVQSSSATMGVVIVLASQGIISLEGGIAMALGANIGTCATAGLAAIGKPREAVRVAVAHVTFKIVGVFIIVWFIPYLADFVRWISPVAEGLSGTDKLAAETPRQVANAHTIFNVGLAFAFLPFAAQFSRFCEWVVKDKPLTAEEAEEALLKPKYLDDELLSTPSLALGRVRLEVGRLGEHVNAMFHAVLPATLSGTKENLLAVAEMDEYVDSLHGHIIEYLRQVGLEGLSPEQTSEFVNLMEAANNMENTGDIIETDLVTVGLRRLQEGFTISDATARIIRKFHQAVAVAMTTTVQSVIGPDEDAAKRVVAMKNAINELSEEATMHCAKRLVADEPNRLRAYTREMEIIERFKRIYYFAKRTAKTSLIVPEEEVEQEPVPDEVPEEEE